MEGATPVISKPQFLKTIALCSACDSVERQAASAGAGSTRR